MENWKAIENWSGWYEVSDAGRVRSLDRFSHAGKNLKAQYKGKLLKAVVTKNGYAMVSLTAPGKREYHNIHRLVAAAFIGPCPMRQEVCHNNNVRNDNRLENLRYDTRRNNALDRKAHGTNPTGEHSQGIKNGMAVLDESKVKYIRSQKHRTLKSLADELGIHLGTVHYVRTRKSWRHIK